MEINKIVLDQNLGSQAEAFKVVANAFLEAGIIDDVDAYIAALEKREAEGTTGLIDGFAIPHGKAPTVKDGGVVYVRNNSGIEWNSLDGSPITDIFGLAIPDNGGSHLDTLVAISTKLMDPEVCASLRAANNEDEINEIFK